METDGAVEIVEKIAPALKNRGLVLVLRELVVDVLKLDSSLSDRIIVIHEGKITGELEAGEANENNLGLLMMGGEKREGGDEE